MKKSNLFLLMLLALSMFLAGCIQMDPTAKNPTGAMVVSKYTNIVGSGPVVADGLTKSTIVISLIDDDENPIVGVRPSFSATDTGGGNIYDLCSISDSRGLSKCTLRSTRAETKVLQITLNFSS
ncbi:MAG: Ig-like domain-containing protein [Bacteriovoracaceae bacterium]|nr:Ig-like domain-containing protein [Bacteriovoracaceae bacterium]